MSNVGVDNPFPPNGYREPSSYRVGPTKVSEPTNGSTNGSTQIKDQGTGAQSKDQGTSAQSKGKEGITLSKIVSFTKSMAQKAQGTPYVIPLAAGTAGFVLGVLASSRILRQLAYMAGGYAVKEAVKAAPKDEILAFAKRTLLDAIEKH